jgi:CO/xanthine dehydrogenase FAD-binding subunit
MYTNNFAIRRNMGSYLRPSELHEALSALADRSRVIVAGGTDFYPARVGKPLDDDVLDVTGLSGLRRIVDEGECFRVGALTTWSDVLRTPLPPWFDGLKLAAKEVGAVQVQNAGTVVGNLCNASPAADGVPCLLALDALVELASDGGERRLPLADFILGNRKTARRADELVTGLVVPKPKRDARATFLKLGARKYLVISIVMVAAVVERAADGTVAAARVAVGSCSAVAKRLVDLEHALFGRQCDAALGAAVTADHVTVLTPIGDVRGTAEYRREAARTLVARALSSLGGAAG